MQGPQVLVCMGCEDDWYAPEGERVDLRLAVVRTSEAVRGHQRPSEAIRGYQRQSAAYLRLAVVPEARRLEAEDRLALRSKGVDKYGIHSIVGHKPTSRVAELQALLHEQRAQARRLWGSFGRAAIAHEVGARACLMRVGRRAERRVERPWPRLTRAQMHARHERCREEPLAYLMREAIRA